MEKAKQKAEELVDKFRNAVNEYSDDAFNGHCIQCALVCVDEILKIADEEYYKWHFWEDVKKEILKL